MPTIFWIGVGIALFACVVGAFGGARAQSASFRSGAAIGLYAGFMAAFPLIAIGISSS